MRSANRKAAVNGGFSLARTPSEITMLDIVEAIEGPVSLTPTSARGETGGST